MKNQEPRQIPRWAWVLAVLLFPPGVFVAFGCARLLSWWRSVLFAVLSYASLEGFLRTLLYLEDRGVPEAVRLAVVLGGHLLFSAWGFALYRIGAAARYWSPAAQKRWRGAGWFAVAVFAFGLLGLALLFILPLVGS
jgi:hypothetical protein